MHNISTVGIMNIGGQVDFDYFYFDRLKQVVDKTVVLLDNVEIDIDADIVVRLDQKNRLWNDGCNRLMSTIAAVSLYPDWILSIDSDEDIDHRIQTADDLKSIIASAEKTRCNAVSFYLREMWEKKNQYRSDGIWGKKVRTRLRKNMFKCGAALVNMDVNARFHREAIFPGAKIRNISPPIKYEIYHYGCFTKTMREARMKKYKELDPSNKFQSIGYDYLVDVKGLEVKNVIGK